MKKILISTLIAGSLLTGCIVAPGGEYGPDGVMIAPILPPVVVLEEDPYYFYGDFYYHYTNDSWYYSRSRRGPWAELPRDRYPREGRFNWQDRSQEHDRWDRDRHHDDRRY